MRPRSCSGVAQAESPRFVIVGEDLRVPSPADYRAERPLGVFRTKVVLEFAFKSHTRRRVAFVHRERAGCAPRAARTAADVP